MKKYWLFIWSILLFLWLIYFITNYSKDNYIPSWCEYDYVKKVYDWDTVLAEHLWKVRLLWIDAPELYHPSLTYKDYKYYGCWQESTEIANKKLEWKKIIFCSDKLSKDKWKYGRKLRYAMINSWTQLIPFWLYLLKTWYTKVYKYAPFKYKKEYLTIEKKLKKAKIWVWSKICLIQDQEMRQKYTHKCNIKGYINSKWQKYYYFPVDGFYKKIKINKTWEKLFCSYKKAEQEWFTRIWKK